jgi:methionyl-tRNA formyltransferase
VNQLNNTSTFVNSYILVGSDFNYGLECVRAILKTGIPVSAIGGLNASRIAEDSSLTSSKAKVVITDTEKPWEDFKFVEATQGKNKVGISCGLDSIVPIDFLASRFCINTHPAALPFNRGSHQSFWAIMEETLGGGSIHIMTEKIDNGPILFQKTFKIPEDMTSRELQAKQLSICVELLREHIKDIFLGNFKVSNQNGGSIHFKQDIQEASTIKFGEKVEVKELFKLVRATFNKNNGFWIESDTARYQVVIKEIKKKQLSQEK